MGNLVDHARRELNLIDEDPEIIEMYIKVVEAFSAFGHSTGSAKGSPVSVINDLLMNKNLSPLTDNPDEWIHHNEETWGSRGGIWQNKRNSEAFSSDGGKTYDLLSERTPRGPGPKHISKSYKG